MSAGDASGKRKGLDLTSRLYANSLHVGGLTEKAPAVPWAANPGRASAASTLSPSAGAASTRAGLGSDGLPSIVSGISQGMFCGRVQCGAIGIL
jgi:hypothetical protein